MSLTMTPSPRGDTSRARTESRLQQRLSIMAASLAVELADRLKGPVKRSDVDAEVIAALQDLQGSVAFEALPEMACRLAEYRLSANRDCAVHVEPAEERSRM